MSATNPTHLQKLRRVAIEETVQIMRKERQGVVQCYDYFLALIENVWQHALATGILNGANIPTGADNFNVHAERVAYAVAERLAKNKPAKNIKKDDDKAKKKGNKNKSIDDKKPNKSPPSL